MELVFYVCQVEKYESAFIEMVYERESVFIERLTNVDMEC